MSRLGDRETEDTIVPIDGCPGNTQRARVHAHTPTRACTWPYTHPHAPAAPCSGLGRRAQKGQLTSYINNLCLQVQSRQGFSIYDGGRRKVSEPPKLPCPEQGCKLACPASSHTPFPSPQAGSILGLSPLDPEAPQSQAAQHFSRVQSLLGSREPYPRPQGRGHCAPWYQELAHFGDNEVGHQLSVLFHVLSDQGHRAVHHLWERKEA